MIRFRRRGGDAEGKPGAPGEPADDSGLGELEEPGEPGPGEADGSEPRVPGDGGGGQLADERVDVVETGPESEESEEGVEDLGPALEEPQGEEPQGEEARRVRRRLRERLGLSRSLFDGHLGGIRRRGRVDEATFEELEEALLLADAGLPTTTRLLDSLREGVRSRRIGDDGEALIEALRVDMEELFAGDDRSLHLDAQGPNLWLFVGVNGAGKTTTIGKLAARERAAGRSVVLAAGDTFRAGAGDQLETWAERAGVTCIRGADGADPSSVIFDAVQHAAARGIDLVLADTAGRLHTKLNLMEELRKVHRIASRPPAHLTEVLLVLDATTGQNGLAQARQFTEAAGVTGIVLTKLDGTAKGGIVLSVRAELGLPIKLVGLGEAADDLVEFDPASFAAALVSRA